jgi:glycine dehydrogenase
VSDLLPSFAARHIGPADADISQMLEVVGHPSLAALAEAAMPAAIRATSALDLAAADSEAAVLAELRALAARNTVATSMIGLGYYGTHTPGVIARNVLESPAWYTAYTPYQPEISQGRLEALLNFQTMISDLTGLEVAGASLLDEATAAAEAMTLMRRSVRGAADSVLLVDEQVFPQTLAVMATRAAPLGIEIVVADLRSTGDLSAAGERSVFGVVVQDPAADGAVADLSALAAATHDAGALFTVIADLLALTILRPPGEWGADVVVGSTQRFGVPMGFGGPHAGYIAVTAALARSLPGRLVGVSVDSAGAPAYRLALQTREQHIRREKATSNICTAQVLLAVMASMYAVYHGPDGLMTLAHRIHGQAQRLADALRQAGLELAHDAFFDTLRITVPDPGAVSAACRAEGILVWVPNATTIQVSLDETTTAADLAALCRGLGVAWDGSTGTRTTGLGWPAALLRTTAFLTHPVFHAYRNETAMLRYLRRLSDRDFALDRGMIPLGSCTMKLNATTEMAAVTWPEFGALHPFAPREHSAGSRELIGQLAAWLCTVTGYDAVSLQPNAGSQGELSGLLAISAYHQSRGEEHRRICLIPASAHGTNAASAVMAGMRVVVVGTTPEGDIDMGDFSAKVEQHRDDLAAVMVTYPSTHGVFEESIGHLCAQVHDAGGQVYVDGANLNALVGLAQPGRFGADVSHLNLHKTFCIPHGGGGPGVGPVAVRSHLAPHLPNHPLDPDCGPASGIGPVSAAPFGSASILPISWAYIRLMGGTGLTRATQVAILNANYVARRLNDAFPVLYTGPGGLVAHECILDLRTLTRETGITVDDVAKRLIDYGFHAPTMSFPVAGTLMVEPTESEDLAELDRFCDAMLAIRAEIDAVARGEVSADASVLRGAPHTAAVVSAEQWTRAYGRQEAAFPPGVDPRSKYWPPVGRIDGAYGDRHLVCACPPPEAFA